MACREKPDKKGVQRHQYRNGVCRFCGASQKEMLRLLANRRTKRREAKLAARHHALVKDSVPIELTATALG